MLHELWDFLTTPASKEARQKGYLYQSIALSHRARRCQTYWEPHLVRAKEMLRQATLEHKGHVAVLGSGLLLETPLDLLRQRFSKVTLIDVVHTKDVREKIAVFNANASVPPHEGGIGHISIELIEMDLNRSTPSGRFDFVVSANLLSQLPLVPTQQMRRKGAGESALLKTADELQTRHMQMIKELAPHGLLFTDFEVHIRDREGDIIETGETVSKRLDIFWEKTWDWNLAPAPELSSEYSVQLKVGVLNF
jgi:hypothetical protein